MRNTNNRVGKARKVVVQIGRADSSDAARKGWMDRIAGKGFSAEYESGTKPFQMNYEIGRLWAASFIAAGTKPPVWNAGTILPKAIEANCERVCTMHGAPSIPHR